MQSGSACLSAGYWASQVSQVTLKNIERAYEAMSRLDADGLVAAFPALTGAQNAAAPASATVVSCSPSPPLTPTAPTTWPSRLSGMPPAKTITRPSLDAWMP